MSVIESVDPILTNQDSQATTLPGKAHIRSKERTPLYWRPVPNSGSGDPELEANWSSPGSLTGKEYNESLTDSTSERPWSDRAEYELEILFDAAKEETFEDGIETDFSRQLMAAVRNYGEDAMSVISHLIIYEKINSEVASEVLRWLGVMIHPRTYGHRQWLLESALNCSSSRVRDGAILGLSYLDDPHAVPYLRGANQREQCKELQDDMNQVLQQLEEHLHAVAAENPEG